MKEMKADVLIIGYGFSGSVAAIVAHDLGAEVVIAEKMEHFGGCSILSGGGVLFVKDPEQSFAYFKGLCGGRTPDSVIRAQVEMMRSTPDFIAELCKVNGAKWSIRARPGVYPIEGRNGINSLTVREVPGFDIYPWLVPGPGMHGFKLMKVLEDNIVRRGITTLVSTPAKELLVGDDGAVTGAVVRRNGTDVKIHARRGVLLACGGFEHDEWLKLQNLPAQPYYSMAPLSHTGDGIKMSQKVGARLWHMWHVHGSYGFKFPEFEIAFRHHLSGARDPFEYRPFWFKMRWIIVDREGKRFMNEYPPAPQDTPHRALWHLDPDVPCYPRIPSYMIFDERARLEGPIAEPLGLQKTAYHWSSDNSREIEKGWILSASTLAELAAKIKVDARPLQETVQRWNQAVINGVDADFKRPKETMSAPIQTPPFYALETWPVITNTQGGPEHDERQRVINYAGDPVPRLYAAGELGSMYGYLYELGGNLGECISSGRIAGMNLAKENPLPL